MRLIDADEFSRVLIEHMIAPFEYNDYDKGLYDASLLLKNTPTIDAVEVVRCKDCKYCSYSEEHEIFWCDGTRVVPWNGYCYKGRMKDAAGEKKS